MLCLFNLNFFLQHIIFNSWLLIKKVAFIAQFNNITSAYQLQLQQTAVRRRNNHL
jgi:hypothetical protein